MHEARQHLPDGYSLRRMQAGDHAALSALCARVYPTERPYSPEELAAHQRLFPEGQVVAVHVPSGQVAGAHFTLRLRMAHFHVDDPWEQFTAGGSFTDHEADGPTLYGADLFVDPAHQHHGLARALTVATRELVSELGLWRMVGGSRLPGYGARASEMDAQEYVARVRRAELVDPVLTAHLHDGWQAVTAVQGYLPHDDESAGWAAVIQWLNPEVPPPPGMELERLPRRQA